MLKHNHLLFICICLMLLATSIHAKRKTAFDIKYIDLSTVKMSSKGDVDKGFNKFIAVGAPKSNVQGAILMSQDGKSWHEVYNDEALTFQGVAYGYGKIVAVGGTQVVISNDGKNWRKISEGLNGKFFGGLNAVAYGDGLFVAVGAQSCLIYSKDGENWLRYSGGTLDSDTRSGSTHLYGVYYHQGKFFVTGNRNRVLTLKPHKNKGVIVESNVNQGQIMSRLNEMAYGNGKYVAVGTKNDFVSTDGKTWKKTTQSRNLDWQNWGIAFGKGKFVVACAFGRIFVSESGESGSWQEVANYRRTQFSDIEYGNGLFIAIGPRGILYLSKDGVKWQYQGWPKDFQYYRMRRIIYIP